MSKKRTLLGLRTLAVVLLSTALSTAFAVIPVASTHTYHSDTRAASARSVSLPPSSAPLPTRTAFVSPPPTSATPTPAPAHSPKRAAITRAVPTHRPVPTHRATATHRPVPKKTTRPPASRSRSYTRPPLPHTGSARAYAQQALSSAQYGCLDRVITRESGWNPYARNPSSGAYGLGQALPGSKMASKGSDWRTNAVTQIRWAISYMNGRYGSPCGAWAFWQSHRWY